jgi:hypothetical protein
MKLYFKIIFIEIGNKKLSKWEVKNWCYKWSKIDFFRCSKWVVINLPKSGEKMIKIGGVKIDPKMVKNWFAMGGSKIVKNRLFGVGGSGPSFL